MCDDLFLKAIQQINDLQNPCVNAKWNKSFMYIFDTIYVDHDIISGIIACIQ